MQQTSRVVAGISQPPLVLSAVTIETMTSMQHKFGALDLIRAGLQDLDRARTLFDELHNDGIDDDRMRLLLATLEKACDPDIALSNLVDIIKVMQSQGKDFTNIIADENSFVRLITVLGVTRHVRRNVQPLF
jgi:glutamate-ammonia-ligase adenylyltransferase